MKAPISAVVSIYYDSPREVREGDALQTPTGRLYLLLEVRRQMKGMHVGRWHLKALVTAELPEGTRIHPIYWYRREKRKSHLEPFQRRAAEASKTRCDSPTCHFTDF